MRRAAKILLVTALALLVLAVGAVVFVGWTVQRSYPDVAGTLDVPGLGADVVVQRDEHGIPTITADDADDLFLAQGFVHAQDRFWEMDFRRHVTAGRLAEWFGPDQVETDAFIRTMGWRRVAEQELPLLDPGTRRHLQAYADGVNAYLDQRSGADLSLEHWLLGVVGPGGAPEPWTPVDSLAWLKAMAWDLRGNMQDEVLRARLLADLPLERVDQLYPGYPYDRNAPIVGGGEVVGDAWVPVPGVGPPTARGTGGSAAPAAAASPAAPLGTDTAAASDSAVDAAAPSVPEPAAGAVALAGERFELLGDVLGPAGSDIGSNSWVIGGDRTASGMPILANDPHLAPAMPSTWYQMHLRCREVTSACPYDVGGFTFAGFPGVIIGRTGEIAWGFTNLDPDVSDLYIERVRGDEVQTVDGFEPLVTREEVIEVAGEEPVTITVRESSHGPLISDPDPDPDFASAAGGLPGLPSVQEGTSYAVALRWTALDPGRTADAVFALDAATSWEQFRRAARQFEVPSQNMVYADVEGNIGYQAPGRVPIRAAGDGRAPVPGWTGEFEWTGYVPFDALPYELNPEAGYVVAANQAVVGPDYPYRLADVWSYGFRSQRIADLIEAGDAYEVEDVQAMQRDTWNANAAFFVPRLTPPSRDDFYAEAQALLDGWDYTQPADSAPAAYFNAFWRNLLELTFHDELTDPADWPSGGDRWFEVMRQLWESPADPWWDDVRTETREVRSDIVEDALLRARDELTNRLAKDPSRWEWGRLHTLTLEHATFGTSGIAPIEAIFNRGPVRLGGGSSIVDATGWDAAEGYEVTAVPSMRMVVDLGDPDGSSWVNLTGQSGHPYAATFVDQVDLWAAGDQLPWAWTPAAVDAATRDRLVLTAVDPTP